MAWRDLHGIGTWLSTIGSVAAVAASGVSLWETVLKQPQLKVYVGDQVSYTRDPYGSYEVFAVPITVSNGGARDGAVMSLRLELANTATGEKDMFDAAYTADASWFAGSDNLTTRSKRPKSPFAPLSIAGRSRWSGTVLFYSPEFREKKIAEPKAQVSGQLSLIMDAPDGWLDRVVQPRDLPAIPLTLQVPNYLPGALLSGDVVRVRVGAAVGGAPVK